MLKVYNTLSKKEEEFKPISEGKVGMYSCGPTVYNYAHIGNLRSYIFVDVLKRTLQYEGLAVKHVMNITDVGHLVSDSDDGDDKMTKALKREGLPMTLEAMKTIALKYEEAFVEDLKKLNILLPDVMPRATDHIAEDIEIIKN
jgi:cysteinyl-tRNA synthetase